MFKSDILSRNRATVLLFPGPQTPATYIRVSSNHRGASGFSLHHWNRRRDTQPHDSQVGQVLSKQALKLRPPLPQYIADLSRWINCAGSLCTFLSLCDSALFFVFVACCWFTTCVTRRRSDSMVPVEQQQRTPGEHRPLRLLLHRCSVVLLPSPTRICLSHAEGNVWLRQCWGILGLRPEVRTN